MRSLHFYTQVLTILILDFRKIIIFLGRNVTTVLAQIRLCLSGRIINLIILGTTRYLLHQKKFLVMVIVNVETLASKSMPYIK